MKNKCINILLLIIFIILLFNFTNNTNEKFELKYRGNILRNGVVYTKEIIKKPEIKWIYNSKEPFNYIIIYNNILLISSINSSEQSNIMAIDAKNGKLIWKIDKAGLLMRPLEVSNNILIAVSEDLKLYAINVSNGKILWKIDRIEGSECYSVPTIYNNVVYLGTTLESEFEEDYIHFCGYDLYTGKIVWEYPIYGSNTAPIIENGKLYINDGWLMLCIDIKTKKLIWKYMCKGWISVDAVLSGNILLVCDTKEGLKALDKNTGKILWKNEKYIFDIGINNEPPVVVKNKIYFKYVDSNNDYEKYLCCMNISDGKLIWKKNVKELGCRFFEMLVVDKYIYATSYPLNIVCFNTETNSILWRHDFPIPKNQKDYEGGYLTIYDSKIYIAATDGKIYCME